MEKSHPILSQELHNAIYKLYLLKEKKIKNFFHVSKIEFEIVAET
jgi:hypothetical protein